MNRIWDKDNLHAWCVTPFDEMQRGPEERAQMLAELGIKKFAYDWREEHIPTYGDELTALNQNNIELLAWWWWYDLDDSLTTDTFELFKRHTVRPRIWVMQETFLPQEVLPSTNEEHLARLETEAKRIYDIAALANSYGHDVDIYTHNGWLGIIDNEIAVIDRARELGATGLGICYNFSHARDTVHDDTVDFPALWARMQPYVTVVNLAGTHFEDGTTLYPGDGAHDLEMMRAIEGSGWRGPIGIIAESGGDAKITLQIALDRVQWLAAELTEPGSGGAKPGA